jgi:aryl-alcohol dehydrogenase-like predicted oxidoreductase
MKKIVLGNSGQSVSQLALGCMQMGTATNEEDSQRMLARYLDAGGTFLDTANCYAWWTRPGSDGGESEALLGRWLAATGMRRRVFLATKGGAMVRTPEAHWTHAGQLNWDGARRDFEGAGAETLRRNLEASLRRLQTDHVDLYYVHVDDWVTPLEETLAALAGMVQAGKARHIGWSNVRSERLEQVFRLCLENDWPTPVALQQQHTYLRPRAGDDHTSIVAQAQLDFLQSRPELALVSYSPILKGIYDDPVKRRAHWSMAPYEGDDSEARLAALALVARELEVLPNQLVLAWLLHQRSPSVIPLVGPRTPTQLEQNLEAVRIELTPEQCARLSEAGVPRRSPPPRSSYDGARELGM